MSKSYYSLGLMSGTSADGVDASIIQSDGDIQYEVILDKYFKYTQDIYENIHNIKAEINDKRDLKNLSKKIGTLEKEITLFHANAVNEIIKSFGTNINLVGFHGQTIFHNAKEKISRQLGDGKLLSQLIKKNVIYNFRENDLKSGGHGAPLTPIFHKILKKKFKIKDAIFINIGGIVNTTIIRNDGSMSGTDIGPGMCLIDRWMRQKLNKNYDKNGAIALSGKVNKTIVEQLLKNFYENENTLGPESIQSFDTKYFDMSFVKNLSIEDGAATLTEYTSQIIISSLRSAKNFEKKIILCGGGRKNDFLVKKLRKENNNIKLIDEYGVNGDFVESQAFAYLAIRSYLKLPITFPETTGVKQPCLGGDVIIN